MKKRSLISVLAIIIALAVGCGQKVEKADSGDGSGGVATSGELQTWHRAFEKTNSDLAVNCAIVLDDGSIVLGGEYKPSNQKKRILLMKLDASGNLVWRRLLSKSLNIWVRSMVGTTDGGFILFLQGAETDQGPAYSFLMKVDQTGKYRWDHKVFNGSETFAATIVPTLDSNFMLLGAVRDDKRGGNSTFLMKIDDQGDELWHKTYADIGAQDAKFLLAESDGGFVISANIDASATGHSLDALLFKVDASGKTLWNAAFGGGLIDVVSVIKADPKKGYWLAGSTQSHGEMAGDVYLVRLDENHEIVWEKSYGDQFPDAAMDAVLTPDGGMIAAGISRVYPRGMFQVYVIKVDEDGEKVWDKHFAIGDRHQGRMIVACPDGGYLVAGTALKLKSNQWQAYLIKMDGDGNVSTPDPTITFLD